MDDSIRMKLEVWGYDVNDYSCKQRKNNFFQNKTRVILNIDVKLIRSNFSGLDVRPDEERPPNVLKQMCD